MLLTDAIDYRELFEKINNYSSNVDWTCNDGFGHFKAFIKGYVISRFVDIDAGEGAITGLNELKKYLKQKGYSHKEILLIIDPIQSWFDKLELS